MNFLYLCFNPKGLQNTALSFSLLVFFLAIQANGQGSHHNSEEFSRNTLAAYVVVSGLGVGITILFLCYLYVRAQTGCCFMKCEGTPSNSQDSNTVSTTQIGGNSGVRQSSFGTNCGLQGENVHSVQMDNLDTTKIGQEEEDPPPSYESVVGIAFKV